MPLIRITSLFSLCLRTRTSLRWLALGLGLIGYLQGGSTIAQAEKLGETTSNPYQIQSEPNLTSFLIGYQHAVKEKSADTLKMYIKLPIKVQYISYDMETKVRQKTFSSVDQILKNQDYFLLPEEFVAKLETTALNDVHVGTQKCDEESQKANTVVDYTVGAPALNRKGKEVMLTLLAEPCAAETHIKTMVLRVDKSRVQLIRILSKKLSDYK